MAKEKKTFINADNKVNDVNVILFMVKRSQFHCDISIFISNKKHRDFFFNGSAREDCIFTDNFTIYI